MIEDKYKKLLAESCKQTIKHIFKHATTNTSLTEEQIDKIIEEYGEYKEIKEDKG